ncbi:NAD(P)H-binding protein [Pseudonocardia cypriaca]|uniref:NAD(P)H dehydrogenase (Quinone) n=1 Tax=Pseudonocardia cypriaca TaxID=882449 RepID=A0A543FYL8_9PSEU|nr:NAD(P)H-binding protein [Pseudonocardia cypriaca]TQM38931.1 NAD(P)H dehydrogenase (quinone) [Pseudonocardia cypriaca]
MTIAITGASGSLGRATAELVLKTVDPRGVVLTTRRPENLADLAGAGAEVRHADFSDPASLTEAFSGVERLLLISTDAVGARVDQHRAAIAAATAAGVGHIVYTSVPEPVPGNPAIVVPDHAATEAALRASSATWTFLRNNLYSELQIAGVQAALASGTLPSNTGTGGAAYVSREDCAAVAAAMLTQDGHAGRIYDVTGPVAVRSADLAALAGALGGRDVELVDMDDAGFAAQLRGLGLPDGAVELVVSFGAATRDGFLSTATNIVEELTGHHPIPTADVVRRALGR